MWSFVSPRIVFGEDALDALREIRGSKALIVTDAGIVGLGLIEPVAERLRDAGLELRVFDGVEPDPSVPTVERGAEIAREFEPDWIIGVGGGSPMDAAKAILVFYERPDLGPSDINPFVDLGLRTKARLVTVPTTSGTGSEVTWMIVLTDPDEGRKMGLGNRECAADLAVVDPAMAAGMPPQLTADTGLDALTHAVEGYTCTWRSDLTDGLCVHTPRPRSLRRFRWRSPTGRTARRGRECTMPQRRPASGSATRSRRSPTRWGTRSAPVCTSRTDGPSASACPTRSTSSFRKRRIAPVAWHG